MLIFGANVIQHYQNNNTAPLKRTAPNPMIRMKTSDKMRGFIKNEESVGQDRHFMAVAEVLQCRAIPEATPIVALLRALCC